MSFLTHDSNDDGGSDSARAPDTVKPSAKHQRHTRWIVGCLGCLALAGAVVHGIRTRDADELTLGWLGAAVGLWVALPLLEESAPFLSIVKSIRIGQFQIDLQDIKRELSQVKEATDTAVTIAKGGIGGIKRLTPNARTAQHDVDELDPQHGRWGGHAEENGRRLSAKVSAIRGDDVNFRVRIVVTSIDDSRPLTGSVVFHLHPTFNPPDVQVHVRRGEAVIERIAWGAFTVGAEADKGATSLELDLATLSDAPKQFRDR